MDRIYILGVKKAESYKSWFASLPSKLISKYCWGSPYIHIAVATTFAGGYPTVIESIGKGVVKHLLKEDIYDIFYVECHPDQRVLAMAWLHEQIGKKYDFSGLFAFLWRKEYQNDDQWFCSELALEACFQADIVPLNPRIVKSWQVTPRVLLAGCEGPITIEEAMEYERLYTGD